MARKSQQVPPRDVADMPAFDDRRIYNNAVAFPADPQSAVPGYAVRPNVRTASKRRQAKTSNVVAFLFLVAAAALLYVGNVIAVNNLAKDVNDLAARHQQILSTNEVLRAEINRKASLERIGLMAQEKYGMTNPKEAPVWFEVDPERVAAVREAVGE